MPEQYPQRELPLALHPELWASLSPEQQELFQNADVVLRGFSGRSPRSLRDIVENSGEELSDVLSALKLLDSMSLVTVESSEYGPMFSLRATPEEHVRIQGPDNRPRWVFIARPVEPPEIDPTKLN